MQYMLIFKETADELARREDPASAPEYWGAWTAYVGALAGSGAVVSGNALQPPRTAALVRVVDGVRHVQDGPFADTHEHLGGYFIIEVPGLDAALDWAARAPCASAGSVEVRPVLPPMAPPAAA
ncbi:MAG: YciI family protein [Burkholderiales bacterium]